MKVLYCLATCFLFTSLVNSSGAIVATRDDIGNIHNYESEFKNAAPRGQMPENMQTIINKFNIPSKKEVFGENGKQKLCTFFNNYESKWENDDFISIVLDISKTLETKDSYKAIMLYLLAIRCGDIATSDGLSEISNGKWNYKIFLNPEQNTKKILEIITMLQNRFRE